MSFAEIVTKVSSGAVNLFAPMIVLLAGLYFAYGLVRYLFAGGDAAKRKESVGFMVRGILALFLMISVWAVVGLLSNLLGAEALIPQI